MRTYKLTIAYDGSRYQGWQRQVTTDNTIQFVMEWSIGKLVGYRVQVDGSGRTDAGVHARGMAANAFMDTPLSAEEIRDYLNRYLPDDIAVREVREASPRFHARYNAIGKTYRYTDGICLQLFFRSGNWLKMIVYPGNHCFFHMIGSYRLNNCMGQIKRDAGPCNLRGMYTIASHTGSRVHNGLYLYARLHKLIGHHQPHIACSHHQNFTARAHAMQIHHSLCRACAKNTW